RTRLEVRAFEAPGHADLRFLSGGRPILRLDSELSKPLAEPHREGNCAHVKQRETESKKPGRACCVFAMRGSAFVWTPAFEGTGVTSSTGRGGGAITSAERRRPHRRCSSRCDISRRVPRRRSADGHAGSRLVHDGAC